jgi:ketosteroid isomerase-like protein
MRSLRTESPAGRRDRTIYAAITISLGLTVLLLAGATNVAAESTSLPSTERAAIRNVIAQQLEAFKRHDGPAAFAHAAPAIQDLFGTPERFMLMVQHEYPPIYRPRSYTFRELQLVEGEFTQSVTIVSEDGEAANAFYLMSRQADGSWRILACVLTPAEGATA